MISTSPLWQVESCYDLVLQLMIFCIFTHISCNVNKSNFHFKRNGRVSTDSFNKINLSILQFNTVNLQIKQFIIFQKFLWNSVQLIWGVIMNLTEITYTKIKYLIRKFPRIRRLSFSYRRKRNKKLSRNCGRSMLNQSVFGSFQEH